MLEQKTEFAGHSLRKIRKVCPYPSSRLLLVGLFYFPLLTLTKKKINYFNQLLQFANFYFGLRNFVSG